MYPYIECQSEYQLLGDTLSLVPNLLLIIIAHNFKTKTWVVLCYRHEHSYPCMPILSY